MTPNPVHRLPAALESAVQRVKLAARGAVERTVESLGLAALASSNAFQRDSLLAAQFELNRKSAVFILAYNEAFDQRLLRELSPRAGAAPGNTPASWDALSLVEDREVEMQVSADRFALEYANACEWELRELDGYVAAFLGDSRNPLRPELIGHAMMRGIEAVSERPEVRKVLVTEIGRSLGGLLRSTYQDIIADLRRAGVQPAGLSVRMTESRAASSGGAADSTGRPSALGDEGSGRPAPRSVAGGGASVAGGFDSRHGNSRSTHGGFAATGQGGRSPRHGSGYSTTPSLGAVDPGMMALMRRLAHTDLSAAAPSGGGPASHWDSWGHEGGASAPLPPNLIRNHREELRQAATGSLDHMVIDVIGSLFEQILSDPKVAPQMARQIGRLQLPVLRAALGDPSFFSSRRHPVRRFVNRIASLGAAFEDYSDDAARDFLSKVRQLVQQVVEGDFDQVAVYEEQLVELERFVTEQARRDVDADGDATRLLSAKEDELRLRALYAQQLQGDLQGLTAPEFVREFIGQVWSQVLVRAAERHGADGERTRRLRHAGRELFMSVQPKASAAQRKTFLAELPKLMQDLNDGMELIAFPAEARRAFFGQLLPAHAESLKAQTVSMLDYNLLARRVDGALDRPLPSPAELKSSSVVLPVLTDAVSAPSFSADEAKRIGLVEEAAVDWSRPLDIDLSADSGPVGTDAPTDSLLPGATTPAGEPAEPTQGKSLADHVQIGFVYQMHLGGDWQKVRLSHVSPGRSFFVFTHGKKHRETVSMTQRMLVRLCEAGRLRTFENGYLLERATERARRQLASLRPSG
jgi:hypothetical protein